MPWNVAWHHSPLQEPTSTGLPAGILPIIGVPVPGPCLRFTVVLTTPGAAEAQTGDKITSTAKAAVRAAADGNFMAHLSPKPAPLSKAKNGRLFNLICARIRPSLLQLFQFGERRIGDIFAGLARHGRIDKVIKPAGEEDGCDLLLTRIAAIVLFAVEAQANHIACAAGDRFNHRFRNGRVADSGWIVQISVHGSENVGLVVVGKRMNPAIVAIMAEPEMVTAARTQKQRYGKEQSSTSRWCAIAVNFVPALSLWRAFNPEAGQAP